jgi:uncharacterized protein HemX
MIGFTDYIKGGIIGLLAGMLLAGAGVWWAKDQQGKAIRVELQAATDANTANQETIESLKKETEAINKSCAARIDSKDKTINRLQYIDSLTSEGVKNEANIVLTGDPILDELNRMWDKPDRQD